ncbi:outer membrane protein assembly factor BamA [Mesohalobacter halotolerans]|uniref:Outer membrane protein assembly factor BamA n=2 Tax=Mesohalobacter halotolerans TaxID=1883405 RepID=A0A4U5TNN8_9FLAO|nr:outer membrane protein assembly factor BamA [Mesohalobacter halotolerans]
MKPSIIFKKEKDDLEKRVNNLNNSLKIFLLFVCIAFSSMYTSAQDTALSGGKKYTIGSLSVSGANSYNEKTVLAFTGLKKGDEIYIPGKKLSEVLEKLWDLGLFSDINFYLTKVEGDVAHLELEIKEVPKLVNVKVRGVKKNKKREKIITDNQLNEGRKVTENLIANTKNNIAKNLRKKGYLNAEAKINTIEVKDSLDQLIGVNMNINVLKGDKVKIKNINIKGNEKLSDAKIRKFMKNTKRKFFLRFWKRSKLIPEDFESDKENIINEYNERGYRDARIVYDSVIKKNENEIDISLKVNEGDRYYFGDISFLGNSAFSDEELSRLMGIKKGDPYNGVLFQEKIADNSKPDAQDLTNLYQNNGYLFSRIVPVETKIYNDTIDYEIRIREGKIAYFDEVLITGNDRTNDNVIYRNLLTRPGQQYSRQAIMSTIRELGQLGFFDAEQLQPKIKNPDPKEGTLDIEFPVVETGSSQIELQGGYGGGGFIGTLGLRFNNFSIRNIFNKEAYKPVPMGDGQSISIRAQASQSFRVYSLSFVEPWLGGRKPVQLSVSLSQTTQFLFNPFTRRADTDRKFSISGISVGFAKRLQIPDRYFTFSSAVSFQHFNLDNFNVGLFRFPNGTSNNLAFTLGLTRDNTFSNPIYPKGGSRFGITAKFTLPYSAFDNRDWKQISEDREEALANNDEEELARIDQVRFDWLEFYKIKFNAEWFNKLYDDLVLRSNVEFGFLGAYNADRGVPPFERFFVGGDGLAGVTLDGREVIRLRGYPNQSIIPRTRSNVSEETFNDGATIYNKFTLELRYPITLNPSASIYALTFMEGGAAFDNFKDFSPFELSRSAGLGLRIFMPAFGLLGIDFGYGFDPIPGTNLGPNGWETHFIIGQQF